MQVGTEHRVGFVEDEERPDAVRERGELLGVGDIAVHGEHGVRDDDDLATARAVGDRRVECFEVAVRIDRNVGVGQARAVDDRRVVELVRADQDTGIGEGGEYAEVGREPGGKEHRSLGVLPLGECRLELGVDGSAADDESRRAGARAPTIERVVGRGDDDRVLGQTEIVVGREVNHRLAVGRVCADRTRAVEVSRRSPLADRVNAPGLFNAPLGPAHASSSSAIES